MKMFPLAFIAVPFGMLALGLVVSGCTPSVHDRCLSEAKELLGPELGGLYSDDQLRVLCAELIRDGRYE